MQAMSTRNSVNQNKQVCPSTLGRQSMVIVRHELVIDYALFQINWLYFLSQNVYVLDFVVIIIYLIGKRAKLCK